MDLFGFTDGFTWQDATLTLGALVFLIALIPTLVGDAKPSPLTSLLTGSVLLVFAATYLTLGLYFASITTAVTGTAWLVILWQSVRNRPDSIDGRCEPDPNGSGQA
jgi:hypothetical protein